MEGVESKIYIQTELGVFGGRSSKNHYNSKKTYVMNKQPVSDSWSVDGFPV